MGYVTAITNRAPADIIARNSKAFWNVVDWTRVYGNSSLVRSLTEILLSSSITFDVLTTPTITTFPSVTDFNTFLANIERIRVAVIGEAIPGTSTSIKDDYVAGPTEDAPDYVDANLWESTLDEIWDYWGGPSLLECPTLSGNLTITTGNQGIYIDCIDCATFDIDLQSTANLYII